MLCRMRRDHMTDAWELLGCTCLRVADVCCVADVCRQLCLNWPDGLKSGVLWSGNSNLGRDLLLMDRKGIPHVIYHICAIIVIVEHQACRNGRDRGLLPPSYNGHMRQGIAWKWSHHEVCAV